ncbi:MAG: protein TolQ [Deltaproteobacteria bacterium]|nr:MAG: protein TolQ [Deltaproteobacteria bacterium]
MGGESLNVVHMFLNAGWVVKLVLLLLLSASITSWAIIFIKYRSLRKAYRESVRFTEAFWQGQDLSAAFTFAKRLKMSPVARMYRIGYIELKRMRQVNSTTAGGSFETASAAGGLENIKRTLRRSSTTELTRLSHLIPFLATTGNTAPFVGLFGTVWGIMNSFHNIGEKGSASLAAVAPGISEALVATAVGLAVAIPAVVAYNFFIQRIRVLDAELQNFSADFLNIIERDILRAQGGQSG